MFEARQRPKLTAGQEWVWDYPRPPKLERTERRLRVKFAGRVIAESGRGWRVLETSHPPTYYFATEDVDATALQPGTGSSWCEFKGRARYFDLVVGEARSASAAWGYPQPSKGFEELAGAIAFYPSRVSACFVDGERVWAQEGDFYGGWITSQVAGPFKGGPATRGW